MTYGYAYNYLCSLLESFARAIRTLSEFSQIAVGIDTEVTYRVILGL